MTPLRSIELAHLVLTYAVPLVCIAMLHLASWQRPLSSGSQLRREKILIGTLILSLCISWCVWSVDFSSRIADHWLDITANWMGLLAGSVVLLLGSTRRWIKGHSVAGIYMIGLMLICLIVGVTVYWVTGIGWIILFMPPLQGVPF
jgi:hypothetical protein